MRSLPSIFILASIASLPIVGEVSPPKNAFLFQPCFYWANGAITAQGTGFFIRTGNGKTVAITSAHFINFNGPALRSAEWLSLVEGKPQATLTQLWGSPGNAGVLKPLDLRPDFLVFFVPTKVPEDFMISLDTRTSIPSGELIWLPNKKTTLPGYTLISGHVLASTTTFITIELDVAVPLQSQSGTPIISQDTGKVIGTVSLGDQEHGHTVLTIAPASALLQLVASQKPLLPVHSAIGKTP